MLHTLKIDDRFAYIEYNKERLISLFKNTHV